MERPAIKDKVISAYVDQLELELKKFQESPYVETYITIRNQIDSFNEQLTITGDQVERSYSIKVKGREAEEISYTIEKGKIDLFADKDSKEFDRSWKYMLESVDMNKKLDELRKLMNPEQQKDLLQKENNRNLGMAEKIAMRNGK